MLKPIGLTHGHYECRALDETLPVFTDLLAMNVVERANGEAVVQHPNTGWRLVVHEAGRAAPDKPHNNHYGVRVARVEEVVAGHAQPHTNKPRYKPRPPSPPPPPHLPRSGYFLRPGGDTLHIDSY